MQNQVLATRFCATLVYAKCDDQLRLEIWEDLYSIADDINSPWLIGGDFNVVLNEEEKIGGLPMVEADFEDF